MPTAVSPRLDRDNRGQEGPGSHPREGKAQVDYRVTLLLAVRSSYSGIVSISDRVRKLYRFKYKVGVSTLC